MTSDQPCGVCRFKENMRLFHYPCILRVIKIIIRHGQLGTPALKKKEAPRAFSCFFQEIGCNSRSKMTSPQETNLEEFWPAGASSQESQ